MSSKTKPTSFDIAYRAGVSQSTVSRALRGSPLVNLETRRKIQAIAKELNYKVDKNASNLRCQHSVTLALLLFEDPTANDTHINPFFLNMLGSITRACALQGYDLLVSFQQLSDDWHAEYQDSHKADGLILLGYGDYTTYRGKLEELVAQDTHFVRWGAVMPDQPGVSIGCDNREGGRLAAEHLLALGRRRIAFVGRVGPSCPEFEERYRGHADALAAAGLALDPALQQDCPDSTEHDGHAAMRALLERGQRPDAVFAASDLIAIGAIRALEDAGLRVPADVAVVGFDDQPVAACCSPPLTTVLQDTRLAGERLVAALIAQIQGQPATSEVLAPRLVIRRSCGAPPAAPSARAATP
jgi:DNA-binding LacI/PurR family transcriptional regulator